MRKASVKHSRHRLGGGGGLSLDAFVNAKSKPRVNPSDIRKRREYYENAKKVKQYKTLVKHLPQQEQKSIDEDLGGGPNTGKEEGDFNDDPISNDNASHIRGTSFPAKREKNKKKKGRNALEGVRQDFMKKKQETQKLEEEREEALKAKEAARIKALQTRKDLKEKMFKRTNSGQPLMKHRLEHILESIQQQQGP